MYLFIYFNYFLQFSLPECEQNILTNIHVLFFLLIVLNKNFISKTFINSLFVGGAYYIILFIIIAFE